MISANKIILKKIINEEEFDKSPPFNYLKNFLIIFVVILFLPLLYTNLSKLTSSLINSFTGNNFSLFSKMVCSIGNIEASQCSDFFKFDFNGFLSNAFKFASKEIPYFDNLEIILFVLLASSFLIIQNFIGIVFQIIERIIGTIVQFCLLISWASAKILENDYEKIKTLTSLISANILINYIQIITLYISFNLPFVLNYDGLIKVIKNPTMVELAKVLIFLGFIFSIDKGPEKLQQLIGANANSQQNEKDVATMGKTAVGIGVGAGMVGNAMLKNKDNIMSVASAPFKAIGNTPIGKHIGNTIKENFNNAMQNPANPLNQMKNGISTLYNNVNNNMIQGFDKVMDKFNVPTPKSDSTKE